MKYLKLFEQFEEGHKFDLLDLFTISPSEVKELFFRELRRTPSDLENIQVFLDSGLVGVHTKGQWGRTPLHWAARNNHLELAKVLISSGAEVNAESNRGWTPLHSAAYYNSLELAKLLISSGAEVDVEDDDGWTPLALATLNGHQEMQELLISHGDVR